MTVHNLWKALGMNMGKTRPPKAGFPSFGKPASNTRTNYKDSEKITINSRVHHQLCQACGGTGRMIFGADLDARPCDDCGGDGLGSQINY